MVVCKKFEKIKLPTNIFMTVEMKEKYHLISGIRNTIRYVLSPSARLFKLIIIIRLFK